MRNSSRCVCEDVCKGELAEKIGVIDNVLKIVQVRGYLTCHCQVAGYEWWRLTIGEVKWEVRECKEAAGATVVVDGGQLSVCEQADGVRSVNFGSDMTSELWLGSEGNVAEGEGHLWGSAVVGSCGVCGGFCGGLLAATVAVACCCGTIVVVVGAA